MNALFDTNILIDYLNGNIKAKKEIERFDTALISIITKIEVLVGASSVEESKMLSKFIKTFKLIELDEKIADEAVRIRRKNKIKLPDAIILATAKVKSCQLITRNTKDFGDKDPSIRVPYT